MIQELMVKLTQEGASSQPSAVILEQKQIAVGKRPGGLMSFHIPDPDHGDWRATYALMQLDLQTFVVLELRVNAGSYDQVKPIYEAVLDSLDADAPERLNQQRQTRIAAAEQWLKTI